MRAWDLRHRRSSASPGTCTRRSCAGRPRRRLSSGRRSSRRQSNLWSELGVDLGAPGRLADAGDLNLPDSADAIGMIEGAVRLLIADGGAPLVIGGDHAVTYPVVRAVAARHPGLTILHIDAHPDLYDEFEGNRLSHACPFARIMEEGLAARLVQVGIRTMNGHQREQARRFGVETIDMRAWAAGSRSEVTGPRLRVNRSRRPRPGVCSGRVAPRAGRLERARRHRRRARAPLSSRRRRHRRIQPESGSARADRPRRRQARQRTRGADVEPVAAGPDRLRQGYGESAEALRAKAEGPAYMFISSTRAARGRGSRARLRFPSPCPDCGGPGR